MMEEGTTAHVSIGGRFDCGDVLAVNGAVF